MVAFRRQPSAVGRQGRAREARHDRELALLDAHAALLNAAAGQALADQAEPDAE
jgi:hypothetical protein